MSHIECFYMDANISYEKYDEMDPFKTSPKQTQPKKSPPPIKCDIAKLDTNEIRKIEDDLFSPKYDHSKVIDFGTLYNAFNDETDSPIIEHDPFVPTFIDSPEISDMQDPKTLRKRFNSQH